MTSTLEEFRAAFKVDDLTIASTAHWEWSLRPQQATLGSGVISLRTPCKQFSAIPAGAGADLQAMVTLVESALKRVFQYDKINYLMLMMVDAQVHMHVIPRYSGNRTFAGKDWSDAGWPKFPDLSANLVGPDAELARQVRDALRQAQGGAKP